MRHKTIVHIDMDAFFAAIEQRDNPALRGKPVVVGADPRGGKGRGVVSTCSYEARRYGIHSAMPISVAYRKCPHAVFLPVNGRKYSETSDRVFRILYDFTPDVEAVSIDEAFLDITTTHHLFGTPVETCRALKNRIKAETNLTASVGIAPVKMAAKIASDICKPDGLLEVLPEKLHAFLWLLPVEKLWGVGPKTTAALHVMGIMTISDLARANQSVLRKRFGELGGHMYRLAHGIDERGVCLDEGVKSVSNEHTFERDTDDKEKVYAVLLALSEKVSRRLRMQELKGKTITVKVRLAGFQTYTRARAFSQRTNFSDTIYTAARELFDEFYSSWMRVRLVGVRVSHFDDAYVQESLFPDPEAAKKEQVYRAIDNIKDKFGENAIRRGVRKEVDS